MAGRRTAWNALDNADACLLKLPDLVRIVRKQPHSADPERFQGLRGKGVVSRIGRESEPAICFHRVETLVLQFIGLQFIDQANAAAFLREIEHNTGRFFRDLPERKLELCAAVAPLRRENVAGETLRVDANQRRLGCGGNIAHSEDNTLLHIRPIGAFEAEDPEMAETARKIRFRYLG